MGVSVNKIERNGGDDEGNDDGDVAMMTEAAA